MRRIINIFLLFCLLLPVIYIGYSRQSTYLIILYAGIFSFSYIMGKKSLWLSKHTTHGVMATVKNLIITYFVQCIIVSIIYFCAYGISSATNHSIELSTNISGLLLAGYTFSAILAGTILLEFIPASKVFTESENTYLESEALRLIEEVDRLCAQETAHLILEAAQLSKQETAMPVQIFNLAKRLADSAEKEETVAALNSFLQLEHSRFGFGRRVVFTSIRFMSPYAFSNSTARTIESMILQGLDDSVGWVRYDAVWAAQASQLTSEEVSQKIRLIIEQLELHDSPPDQNSAEGKLLKRAKDFFSGAI